MNHLESISTGKNSSLFFPQFISCLCLFIKASCIGIKFERKSFAAGPVITRAPASVGVDILKNVSLPCSATGVPPPTVTWLHAGRELEMTGFFRQRQSGALVIKGRYGLNETGGLLSSWASEITKCFQKINQKQWHNLKETILLRTELWKQNSPHRIVESIVRSFHFLTECALPFSEVHKEHEGMYTCRLQNQFGITEVSAFLTVTGVGE